MDTPKPGKTILVVDDDPIAREGFASVLRRQGYEVVLAANARAALEVMRGGVSPALVLLDMMMPGGDGWTFLHQRDCNETWAMIPVIVVTAVGIASDEWAASLGACAYLRKPIEVETLVAEVERWV